MRRRTLPLLAALAIGWSAVAERAGRQHPAAGRRDRARARHRAVRIVAAEISRPKAKGDITLKAELSFSGAPPYRVKLRRAEPGAEDFNNRPRYDLAAYELQKLFLDPAEYVVPPTALRMVPLADLRPYAPEAQPDVQRLRRGAGGAAVLAAGGQGRRGRVRPAALRRRRRRTRATSAQLNVLTSLIEHGDSNVGNFLISRAERGARVFSVDNGVAFAFNESDRGELWKDMRVDRLPADTVARLRARHAQDDLHARLGVLAQWRLQDGRWIADAARCTTWRRSRRASSRATSCSSA